MITSSKFDHVKQRLALLMAGRKVGDEDPDRPTLRKRQGKDEDKKEEEKEEKPPVLKRRP